MNAVTTVNQSQSLSVELERVLMQGDLGKLSPDERLSYYKAVCQSVGLNPLTKPFEYITLNGKLTLYARKDCTDQLRTIHGISVTLPTREIMDGVYVVTAHASNAAGRSDESTGCVPLDNLKGEARANAMMKAETKAKRRVTLSICGLGLLDETEVESIPDARTFAEAKAAQQEVMRHKLTAPEVLEETVPEDVTRQWAALTEKGGLHRVLDYYKESIGEAEYRAVLQGFGYQNRNDIKKVSAGKTIIFALYKRQQQVADDQPEPVFDAEVMDEPR